MHPDAIIAALKTELEEATSDEHRKAIEAEIKRVDALPRPAAKADEPETAFDTKRNYVDALKVELAEAVDEKHKAAIKAEIKRAEGALEGDEPVSDEPSVEEVEKRKAARAGGAKVQRATSAPGEERETNPGVKPSE